MYEAASGSVITPCIKINNTLLYNIITFCNDAHSNFANKHDKILMFSHQKQGLKKATLAGKVASRFHLFNSFTAKIKSFNLLFMRNP